MSDHPHMHRRADDDVPEQAPPMSKEQLDYFTEQTRRAVDKSLTRYMKRAAVGFLLLFVGFMFNAWNNENQWDRIERTGQEARDALVESGDIIAVDGCNRDFNTTKALRGVLLASRGFAQQNFNEGLIDENQLRQRLAFYSDQLSTLPLPDCRKAQGILTDDADHPLRIPQPMFPTRDGEQQDNPSDGSGTEG